MLTALTLGSALALGGILHLGVILSILKKVSFKLQSLEYLYQGRVVFFLKILSMACLESNDTERLLDSR